MWGCDLCPDCLTMEAMPKNADQNGGLLITATSLPYIALKIRLEDGKLQLLRQILEKAVQKNVLRNVLALEGPDGFGFVISALKRDPNAARLILQTTKQHGCIDGVHNAVLRYETKPKENEEAKPVNKSLAMLFIEQKTFDLVQELQLTTAEWRHIDANGDNLWHYAARAQDLRAVDLFRFSELKGIPMRGNSQGFTPLHEAVQSCDCSANSVLEPIEWLAANTPDVPRDVTFPDH
ncbi:hypothetical protein COOONC_24153 [Cooperia oncophora]